MFRQLTTLSRPWSGEIVAIRAAWRSVGAWDKLRGSTLYSSCELASSVPS